MDNPLTPEELAAAVEIANNHRLHTVESLKNDQHADWRNEELAQIARAFIHLHQENAAAKRRITMLEYLVESHEGDIAELLEFDRVSCPSYEGMGDPADYAAAELVAIRDKWPAADKHLNDAEMRADWPTGEGMREIDDKENRR